MQRKWVGSTASDLLVSSSRKNRTLSSKHKGKRSDRSRNNMADEVGETSDHEVSSFFYSPR